MNYTDQDFESFAQSFGDYFNVAIREVGPRLTEEERQELVMQVFSELPKVQNAANADDRLKAITGLWEVVNVNLLPYSSVDELAGFMPQTNTLTENILREYNGATTLRIVEKANTPSNNGPSF